MSAIGKAFAAARRLMRSLPRRLAHAARFGARGKDAARPSIHMASVAALAAARDGAEAAPPPDRAARLFVVAARAIPATVRDALADGAAAARFLALRRDPGDLDAESVAALSLTVNGPEDFGVCRLANDCGAFLAETLCAPGEANALREVAGLAFADRLYGRLAQFAALEAEIAAFGADRVALLFNGGRPDDLLELGAWLEARGGPPVLVAFDAGGRKTARAPARWPAGAQSFAAAVAATAARIAAESGAGAAQAGDARLRSLLRVCDAAAGTQAEVEAGDVGKAARRRGPLTAPVVIAASLSNASYRAAASELTAELLKRRDVIVLGAHKGAGVDPAADAPRAPHLVEIDALSHPVRRDADLQAAAAVRLAALLAAPPADAPPWVLAAARACASVARVTLASHIPTDTLRAAATVALIRETGAERLIALPGRPAWVRGALIAAARAGLRTADAQALFISARPRYRASCAAAYGAISRDQADLYREAMNPPPGQRIAVVGSLINDHRRRAFGAVSAAAARRRCGLPPDCGVALFAAQKGLGGSGARALAVALEAARAWENRMLVVKAHPQDPDPAIAALRDRVAAVLPPERATVTRDAPLYDLLAAADVTLTQFSNVGLEAAILGKPVVVIRDPGETYVVDLIGMGVAVEAVTAADVIRAVAGFAAGDAWAQAHLARREAYFRSNPALRDGDAARRVAALVEA